MTMITTATQSRNAFPAGNTNLLTSNKTNICEDCQECSQHQQRTSHQSKERAV